MEEPPQYTVPLWLWSLSCLLHQATACCVSEVPGSQTYDWLLTQPQPVPSDILLSGIQHKDSKFLLAGVSLLNVPHVSPDPLRVISAP